MNIKFYLKLIISIFTLTSYCCAALVDTIAFNHNQRQEAYNNSIFADSKLNTYTNENNSILRDESKVDANRVATLTEKEKIAKAVFGAAWADVTVGTDNDVSFDTIMGVREYANPYHLDEKGNVYCDNLDLRDHFQILYWLDKLARDVVKQICLGPTVIDETFLDNFKGYDNLYAFEDFSKHTVATWLEAVRVSHEPGLKARQAGAVRITEADRHLQTLENERDKVDWRDYPRFKELTAEICTLIGIPFVRDFYDANVLPTDFNVLPTGEPLHRWIDSIIRTRHKFYGQQCLGTHGMMNRYTNGYPADLSDAYEYHIASIMIIDAMAKLAIADDGFYNIWASISADVADVPVPDDFIKRVLDTLEKDSYGKTNPEMYRVKELAETVIQKNPGLVRLAGDIFSLYAPKMTLNKVYTELTVSGGMYRGWNLDQMDSFAHVISLTDAEKAANPEVVRVVQQANGIMVVNQKSLEDRLRTEFVKSMATKTYDLYSTSYKGIIAEDGKTEGIIAEDGKTEGIIAQDGTAASITFMYDHCLEQRGHGVTGKGPVRFNLTRNVRPELKHLLVSQNRIISDDYITDLYKLILLPATADNCDARYMKGISSALNKYGVSFLNGTNGVDKDIPKAIELFREAVELGCEPAKEYLVMALNNYGVSFLNGTNGVDKDIPKAIELFREAVELGCEPAKENLVITLNNYGVSFLNGTNGVDKNIPKGIELLREAADLGSGKAKENLAITLSNYGVSFLRGTDGVDKDIPKAIELFREAVELGCEPAKENLATALNNYGVSFLDGTNGVDKNIPKAIELLREAADLGWKPARCNLAVALNKYGVSFLRGTDGVDKDIPKAIKLLRESFCLDPVVAKQNLAIALNMYGVSFLDGTNGVDKNIPKAIELFREAVELGWKPARYNLEVALNKYGVYFLNGTNGVDKDIPKAIELFREATDLGFGPAKKNLAITLNNYGVSFLNGTDGVDKDIPKAIELFREAVKLGCEPAKENLVITLSNYGVSFLWGIDGVDKDIPKGIELFREAADLGSEQAKEDLAIELSNYGVSFLNGTDGVDKNIPKAIELLKEAVDLGYEQAKEDLAMALSNYGLSF